MKLIFGILRNFLGFLLLAKVAESQSVAENDCEVNRVDRIPNALDAQFAKLVGPVPNFLLVFCKNFVVFLEFVLHFDLDGTNLIKRSGLHV